MSKRRQRNVSLLSGAPFGNAGELQVVALLEVVVSLPEIERKQYN
jgi:hypothetical protein